jgi:glucose/mannose-6-phosphate isomerase
MAESFADQCREAFSLSDIPLPDSLNGKQNIVVCGMGGSAIGGDFVRCLIEAQGSAPCFVCRDYELPAFAGPDTLLIACSYSGNTEETLSALRQGITRGCAVVAVTSGGEVAEICRQQNYPFVQVPGGKPPRMSLGYLFIPLVRIAERLDYLPTQNAGAAFAELDTCVERWGVDRPFATNSAKTLASYLFGRVPLVYGLGGWQGVVASRWKGQINENAKLPASASVLPELDHNEIVGFAGTPPDLQKLATLVMLRDPRQHRQVQRRFDLTRELVEMHVDKVLSITAEGEGALARSLDLVTLGDYASIYLALLRAVDPGPVDVIERLKQRLAETGYGRAQAQ